MDCLCAGVVVADFICDPIARMPVPGELMMTGRIALSLGGCASNVALDLAKLGRQASVVGRIGDDAPGVFVKHTLEAAGVETSHLRQMPDAPTSSSLIVNVRNEDRRFIHAFGANALIDGTEVNADLIRSARILYVGGFFLMPRLTADRLVPLFQLARELGVTTVLDVAIPDPGVCGNQLAQVLPWTDVFLPNTDEARLLTDLEDPIEQGQVFRELGAGTVVVTCGGEGAILLSATQRMRSKIFPVEFVDGTGSGDAFDAGYIHGLLSGHPAERCLEIGSALGASCVRGSGATTGVFNHQELDEFLATQRLEIEAI